MTEIAATQNKSKKYNYRMNEAHDNEKKLNVISMLGNYT
jgi:hypothetical protein